MCHHYICFFPCTLINWICNVELIYLLLLDFFKFNSWKYTVLHIKSCSRIFSRCSWGFSRLNQLLKITLLFSAHIYCDGWENPSQPQLLCPQSRGNVLRGFVWSDNFIFLAMDMCIFYIKIQTIIEEIWSGLTKKIPSTHCPWTAGRKVGAVMVFPSNHMKCELKIKFI